MRPAASVAEEDARRRRASHAAPQRPGCRAGRGADVRARRWQRQRRADAVLLPASTGAGSAREHRGDADRHP